MSGFEYYKRRVWDIDSRGFHFRWCQSDQGKWYKIYKVKGKFQIQTEHGKVVSDVNWFKCPNCILCSKHPYCNVFPNCDSCRVCQRWPSCYEHNKLFKVKHTEGIEPKLATTAIKSIEVKPNHYHTI